MSLPFSMSYFTTSKESHIFLTHLLELQLLLRTGRLGELGKESRDEKKAMGSINLLTHLFQQLAPPKGKVNQLCHSWCSRLRWKMLLGRKTTFRTNTDLQT